MSSANPTREIFKAEALTALSIRLNASAEPSEFFDFVDELAADPDSTLSIPVPIEWDQPLLHGGKGEEAANAVEVYSAIGPVNRVVASDPRLWSYLALVTHREYMMQRWPWDEDESFAEAINRRWLITRTTARLMVRHGIARLWWIPNLTFDVDLQEPLSQQAEDPFAYSSWVLQNENRRQYLFEGLIGRTPKLRWAAMRALVDAPEGIPARYAAQELAKRINLEAGFRNLQALPESSVESLVNDLLHDVVEKHRAK
ncbi:DUF6339 family protein [Corynebacterium ureicelerivorans]